MGKVDLTPQERADILKLYLSGINGAKVAMQLKLPRRLVYNCITDAGVLRSKGTQSITDENRELVKTLYLNGKSSHEIEQEIGIGQSTVIKILKEFGISRTVEEGRKIRHEGLYGEKKQKAIDLYEQGMGALPVAEELGVGSEAVTLWLKEAGVHIRGRSEAMKLYHQGEGLKGKNHPMYGQHHSEESKQKMSESKGGKVKIYCKYCGEARMIPPSRVKENGNYCNYKCRSAWLSENQIGENNPNWKNKTIKVTCNFCGKITYKELSDIRSPDQKLYCNNKCSSEHKKELYIGQNNPNFVNGNSYGQYCHKFNDDLKERVRWFFADEHGVRRCFLCGEAEDPKNPRLPVHHVDYDKSTCCNGKIPYMVPLCQSCHNKTSGKNVRERYEQEIKEKLHKETGGKCFYTKEEFREFAKEHPEYFCI